MFSFFLFFSNLCLVVSSLFVCLMIFFCYSRFLNSLFLSCVGLYLLLFSRFIFFVLIFVSNLIVI